MNEDEIFDYSKLPDNCIIFEPRDFYEPSIIHYDDENNRLVYSYDWLVKIFEDLFHYDIDPYLSSIEWIEYNIIGGLKAHENPPLIVFDHFCEI